MLQQVDEIRREVLKSQGAQQSHQEWQEREWLLPIYMYNVWDTSSKRSAETSRIQLMKISLFCFSEFYS